MDRHKNLRVQWPRAYQTDVVAVQQNLVQFHLTLSLGSEFAAHPKEAVSTTTISIDSVCNDHAATATYYSVTSSSTMSRVSTHTNTHEQHSVLRFQQLGSASLLSPHLLT